MLLVHFNLTVAPTCSALKVHDLALTFAGGAFDLVLNLSVRAMISDADLAATIAARTDLGNKTCPVAMTADDVSYVIHYITRFSGNSLGEPSAA